MTKVLSDQLLAVWLVPRCGTATLQNFLGPNGFHLLGGHGDLTTRPELRSVATVRHPFERYVSCLHYAYQSGPKWEHTPEEWLSRIVSRQMYGSTVYTHNKDPHFVRQSEYLKGFPENGRLFPFEQFGDMLGWIMEHSVNRLDGVPGHRHETPREFKDAAYRILDVGPVLTAYADDLDLWDRAVIQFG